MIDPESARTLEARMNVTTQRYLIGRANEASAMISSHETELLVLNLMIVGLGISILFLAKEVHDMRKEYDGRLP